QQVLVDRHGSQCGFCTPGFVMQLYAGWLEGELTDRQSVKDWLAGNLCRCTGYGPIIDAGLDVAAAAPPARAAQAQIAKRLAALARLHPDLGELERRFASIQIRNAGTIGGNIANGSPIGDLPPALIALGATVRLRRGTTGRELPLEAFFLDYGKQDRTPGEFVE